MADYRIDITPQTGLNGFTSVNGEKISDYKGDSITITCSLRNVPTAQAQRIEQAMSGEMFSCTFSSPREVTAPF